jgi:adenylate cyclase
VASRLEGVNKVFGTGIITSHITHEALKSEFLWRRLGDVRVVGRNEPISVYEPMEKASDDKSARTLALHHEALALFEKGDLSSARSLFETLHQDPVAVAYRTRIDRMIRERGSHGPVWDLTEK